MRIALVGNFSQPHCSEVHWAATLEDLGHEVARLQENELRRGTLPQLVQGHDLFVWVRTWPGFVTLDDLSALRAMGIPSVNLHLDLFIGLQREDGLDTDPRWRCDYVFTADGSPESQKVFEAHGINHHWLPAGVYKPEAVVGTPRDEFKHDVVFVGGGVEYAHPEWPYRRQLVQWLMDAYGPRFGKYGHPQRTVRNLELNDLYASAKVAVGDSLCLGFTHANYFSDRLTEAAGRAAFQVFPHVPGIEAFFEPDKEIVLYEYGNFDELRDKIDYYVAHDAEREAIRLAGHERAKRDHTYHQRLQQMLDIVMGERSSAVQEQAAGRSAVSDKARPDGGSTPPAPLKINLGAGMDQPEGYIQVDYLDLPGIDVVHNLTKFPYPFADESAAEVRAVDVIEHLDHYTSDGRPAVIAFIEECHRILKPGGELFIQTPRYDADFLWIDPSHVRGFHEQSFDFFDADKHFGQTTGFYSTARFSVRAEVLPNKNLQIRMTKREAA